MQTNRLTAFFSTGPSLAPEGQGRNLAAGRVPARGRCGAAGEGFYLGQRVRLKVDAQRYRAGDTGRVALLGPGPEGGPGTPLYLCEMDTREPFRFGAFYPDEIEPLD